MENQHPYNACTYLSHREFGLHKPVDMSTLLRYNLSHRYFTYTIKNCHQDPLIRFDVKGILAATCSEKEIKLWNLETGQCRWTITLDPSITLKEHLFPIFKIVEGKLVFTSTDTSDEDNCKLQVIDLEDGTESCSISGDDLPMRLCLAGNRIYDDSSDLTIERSLDGSIIQQFNKENYRSSGNLSSMELDFCQIELLDNWVLASNKYYVKIEETGFFLKNLHSNEYKFIEFNLETLSLENFEYSSAHIYEEYLIIGMIAQPFCNLVYIYDLENKIHLWHRINYGDNRAGIIANVRFNGSKICYNMLSDAYVYDLIKDKTIKISIPSSICGLSSDGAFLFLMSYDDESLVYLFDLKNSDSENTHPISYIISQFSEEVQVLFNEGECYFNDAGALVKTDFNVIHQEKKKADNSDKTIMKISNEDVLEEPSELNGFLVDLDSMED